MRFCHVAAHGRGLAEWSRAEPLRDEAAVLAASDETWRNLDESDWMEAFRSHPRIGETAHGRLLTLALRRGQRKSRAVRPPRTIA